jgi:hypothetical protein
MPMGRAADALRPKPPGPVEGEGRRPPATARWRRRAVAPTPAADEAQAAGPERQAALLPKPPGLVEGGRRRPPAAARHRALAIPHPGGWSGTGCVPAVVGQAMGCARKAARAIVRAAGSRMCVVRSQHNSLARCSGLCYGAARVPTRETRARRRAPASSRMTRCCLKACVRSCVRATNLLRTTFHDARRLMHSVFSACPPFLAFRGVGFVLSE